MVKNSINAISAEAFCPKIMLKIILLLNLEIASAQEWDFTAQIVWWYCTFAWLRTLEGILLSTQQASPQSLLHIRNFSPSVYSFIRAGNNRIVLFFSFKALAHCDLSEHSVSFSWLDQKSKLLIPLKRQRRYCRNQGEAPFKPQRTLN